MEISVKLKEFRLQKGISQSQLAADIHISRSAVAKWENGLGMPNDASLALLADYFDISVDELLSNNENEAQEPNQIQPSEEVHITDDIQTSDDVQRSDDIQRSDEAIGIGGSEKARTLNKGYGSKSKTVKSILILIAVAIAVVYIGITTVFIYSSLLGSDHPDGSVGEPSPTVEKTEILPPESTSGIYLTNEEIAFNVTANEESTYGMVLFCNGSQVDIAYADEMVLKNGKQTVLLYASFDKPGKYTVEARPLNQNGDAINSALEGAVTQITIYDKEIQMAPTINTAADQSINTGDSFTVEWEKFTYPDAIISYSVTVDYRSSETCEILLSDAHSDETSYTVDRSVFTKPGRYGITVRPISSSPDIIVSEECCSTIEIDVMRISIGLSYTLNDTSNAYIVNGIGNCRDSELIIPSTYKGLPVVGIADHAFEGCTFSSVTIPSGIEYIGEWAFLQCMSLREITIPSSLKYIGDGSFNFTDIKKVFISDIAAWCTAEILGATSLYRYDTYLYLNGEPLTELVVPDSVTELGNSFGGLCTLESVFIHGEVKKIADGAFFGCTGLKRVEISNGVQIIGSQAFSNCDSLTELHLPASVTEIRGTIVEYCSQLIKLSVDPQNEVYHSQDNCIIHTRSKALIAGCKNMVIPDDGSVTNIYNNALRGSNITSITIPDSIKSIGWGAFYESYYLTEVAISSSVTSIADRAFCYCYSLDEVKYLSSTTDWENISLGIDVFLGSEVTAVQCSDGTVGVE